MNGGKYYYFDCGSLDGCVQLAGRPGYFTCTGTRAEARLFHADVPRCLVLRNELRDVASTPRLRSTCWTLGRSSYSLDCHCRTNTCTFTVQDETEFHGRPTARWTCSTDNGEVVSWITASTYARPFMSLAGRAASKAYRGRSGCDG